MSTSFDFPLNPEIGDIVILPNGSEAQWNGYAWAPVSGSDVTYPIPIDKGGTNAITATEARINLGLNTATGEFIIPDGTVTNPGIAFTNEPGLGMYRSEEARLGFTAGGNEVLAWSAAGTTLNIGVWPLATGGSSIAFYDSPSGSAVQNTLYLGVNESGYTIQESLNGEAISKALNVTFPTGVNVNNVITVNGASNLNGPVTSNNCFIATGDVNNNAFYSPAANVTVGGTVSAYSASFAAGATGITAAQVGLGSVVNAAQIYQLRPGGNSIYIGWAGTTLDVQIDADYRGDVWPINISGNSNYSNSSGYANSAGSAPANGGTAQNSNQVGGIGGWAYSNLANNPVYLWATEGDAQSQHLTQPGNLSVNYANSCDYSNRTGTVNNATGGYINGSINCQVGYLGRAGVNGGTSNQMNTSWAGNNYQCYVDSSFIGNINFLSDERIKQNIAILPSQHDAYMRIVPISYNFRDISIFEDDGVEHWGWSAQNLSTAVPNAVIGDFDSVTRDGDIQPAGVDDRPILALTVLEVQALVNEVAELRARITALEAT
jgi:Chaperone of endosialidase